LLRASQCRLQQRVIAQSATATMLGNLPIMQRNDQRFFNPDDHG
jgi:hypothetical protein